MNLPALNKHTAPKSTAPERIIQFGEGNFLRAFVDWIIWHMNAKTNFNSSVVVVQPIESGMVDVLNGQDCLYHVNLQGRVDGEVVDSLERIDVISRALNPYSQNAAFMALADQPEIRFVISNTTEAGINFDAQCKFTDAPAASYPGKLTQLLYRRYKTFGGNPKKGLIIMPCELIFLNGHHLKDCIYKYIELWKADFGKDYEGFKNWFTKYNYVCATLVDRIVPGFPRKDIAKLQQRAGYADNLVVQAEAFHLWVIEKPENMSITTLRKEFPAEKVWVKGYIVGTAKNNALEQEPTQASNIVLAAEAGTAEWESIIPVQLTNNTNPRAKLNLIDNPGNLGKLVKVHGNIDTYFGVNGVKNTDEYEIEDTTAIKSIATESKAEVYNLQGQRVEKAVKGLYIVNGKKVMMK